jgi:hypothetical protein
VFKRNLNISTHTPSHPNQACQSLKNASRLTLFTNCFRNLHLRSSSTWQEPKPWRQFKKWFDNNETLETRLIYGFGYACRFWCWSAILIMRYEIFNDAFSIHVEKYQLNWKECISIIIKSYQTET